MNKRLIALALVIVMLFALSACGETEAPVEEAAPAEAEQAPVEESQPEAVVETVDPMVTPTGVEPDSGVYSVTSDVNGISFDYDSKYVAMQNPAGNITVFAGEEASIPYCTVSLIPGTTASDYLTEMASAAEIELGKDLQKKADAPAVVTLGDRDVYYIYYTFKDKDAGGTVACAYYAEDLDTGDVVVYSYTALEGQTQDVEAIAKLAIQTFALAV